MRNAMTGVLLMLAASAACAQGYYYQSTMPDGRTVIGDKPAPGAKEVKQIPLRKGNTSAPLAKPGAGGATDPGTAARQAGDAIDADVAEAQQELQAAKKALEGGREPLPGERMGTAGGSAKGKGGSGASGGTSRLTDDYFKRIKSLEDSVAAAQQKLDNANARRNAAR